MIDLEERVNRVFNPDLRPLVSEAYRCYASGSARGAIVLTWTAVCADLIAKAQILHEEGESQARPLVDDVARAQGSTESEAIPIMLALEKSLLDTAEKLELIDFTQRKQLERIRDDRHLCAHPSIRPLGELYEPTMEYARAHLAAALDAVLIHPPSQGRKIVGSFLKHVVDPGFVYNTEYLTHTFFDRVRPSARCKVVEAAAKFAVLTIEDPAIKIAPDEFADRMGKCLRVFAARDADLVEKSVAKQMTRLGTADPSVQLQALGRLGDLPAFWASLGAPVRNLLNARIETIGARGPNKDVTTAEAKALALVAHPELRATLPALTEAFSTLGNLPRPDIIGQRPDPYFTPFLAPLLKDVRYFDRAEEVAEKAVLPCARFLSLSDLEQILVEWNDNDQCWGRAAAGNLVELYTLTAHLGDERRILWKPIMNELQGDDRIFNRIAPRHRMDWRSCSLMADTVIRRTHVRSAATIALEPLGSQRHVAASYLGAAEGTTLTRVRRGSVARSENHDHGGVPCAAAEAAVGTRRPRSTSRARDRCAGTLCPARNSGDCTAKARSVA